MVVALVMPLISGNSSHYALWRSVVILIIAIVVLRQLLMMSTPFDAVTEETHMLHDLTNEEVVVTNIHFPSEQSANESNTIRYDGLNSLLKLKTDYFSKFKLFCEVPELRGKSSSPDLSITIKITFSCEELANHPKFGTASFIRLFYIFRVAAIEDGNIGLYINCDDAESTKLELIYPWLMGYAPPDNNTTGKAKRMDCLRRYSRKRMFKLLQYDLQRMAVSLLGVSHSQFVTEIAEQQFWSETTPRPIDFVHSLFTPRKDDIPLLASSNIELDDAVIHFRCGDLMSSEHPDYSLMTFHDYTKFISVEAKSIGIITQSFDCRNNRKVDANEILCDRCRIVVGSLVDYVQMKFPKAKISVHNNKEETTALAYSRMILANQTVVGISGFSAFAAVAVFGTSYVPMPKGRSANVIIGPGIEDDEELESTLPRNVVQYSNINSIKVADLKKLWDSDNGASLVVEWFRSQ